MSIWFGTWKFDTWIEAVPKLEFLAEPGKKERPRCSEFKQLFDSDAELFMYLKVVLHWSTCNANLQWYDVARKIIPV